MPRASSWRMVVVFGMALAAVGCTQRPPGTVASTGAPPPTFTAVGPVPGPAAQVSRRPNPYADDRAAITEGRQLFVQYNCSGCHGGRAGGGMGPSLRDVEWLYGDSAAQIFSSIHEGRSQGMPSWGTKLPEDHIWKLVAYVRSLRTPNEPNPPD